MENRKKVIEQYKESTIRKIILKTYQGKDIDEVIQEFLRMAVLEGSLNILTKN